MSGFVQSIYPWVKALHVASVIAWMAGLLYLPRLYVYHRERVESGSDTHKLFGLMESRLLRIVTTPAMLAAWATGLVLVSIPGVFDWSASWPWIKIAGVLTLTSFHFWLAAKRKELERGECATTGRQFRMLNELPAVLMLVIVAMVIARPF